jgi:mRNA interferase MazF
MMVGPAAVIVSTVLPRPFTEIVPGAVFLDVTRCGNSCPGSALLKSTRSACWSLREASHAFWIWQFDVYLFNLDPTIESEIQKTRPCTIVSPDEMNRHIATIIVASMTRSGKTYPTRVKCEFEGKAGLIVLDQFRTVDKTRLIRRLGRLADEERSAVLNVLVEMLAA